MYNLILKGGRVIDPASGLDAVADVALADGRIAAVGKALAPPPGCEVRDVAGRIVTPGLIDLHTHVYWGGTSLGVDAERIARRIGRPRPSSMPAAPAPATSPASAPM